MRLSLQPVRVLLRRKITYVLLSLMAMAAACNHLLDFRARTSDSETIQLILDSPEVRELIARQEANEELEQRNIDRVLGERQAKREPFKRAKAIVADLDVHPERYVPRRLAFIASMHRQSTVTVVARHSVVDFMQHAKARCGQGASQESYYAKVRVSSGPTKGQEGWACMGEDIFLAGPREFRGQTADLDSIRLILDSREVRELIAHQEAMEDLEMRDVHRAIEDTRVGGPRAVWSPDDLDLYPERYIPARLAFRASMQRQPAVTVVARRSYCRFLNHTRARCGTNPLHTSKYVRVRITSGPSKGQEGWSCMFEDIDLIPIFP